VLRQQSTVPSDGVSPDDRRMPEDDAGHEGIRPYIGPSTGMVEPWLKVP